MDGQISLFDLMQIMDMNIAEETVIQPKEKITKKVIKAVKDKVSSYLEKGERITSLAKEEYEKKYSSKMNFYEFEEKIYLANYEEVDISKTFNSIELLKPIAKVFRKLLKSINTLEKGDEGYDALFKCFDGFYNMTLEKSPVSAWAFSSKATGDVLKLSIFFEDGTRLVGHGLKDSSHSERKRNAMFTSKLADYYHEGCTDLAYALAYYYVIMVVSKEIKKASLEEESFFYKKNEDIFEQNFFDVLPGYFRGDPFFREGVLTDEQMKLVERLLSKNIPVKDKAYRPERYSLEWAVGQGQLETLQKCLEPWNILYSETEDARINLQLQLRLMDKERGIYQPFPTYGISISLWYKMFLDIAEEKGAQIREAQFFRELNGHVARAFETKKNIPDATLKAMEDSVLNEYFAYVEFDEDVELDKVSEIAKEFIAFKETFFNGVDISDNQIRFRRLGKHKALGLYYPFIKCLCVDIHSPSSLVHEFGHLVDHKFNDLSEKYDFYAIRKEYERLVDKAMGDSAIWKGNTKYNRDYYLRPTEVFARSFEIYMSRCKGLRNSLLDAPSGYESAVYPSEDSFIKLVEKYFDELLVTINNTKSNDKAI